MYRILLPALFLVLVSDRAKAQDMALSEILVDGEGWEKVDLLGMLFPIRRLRENIPGIKNPHCNSLSPDRSTLFVGSSAGNHIWAFRVGNDGTLTAGQPYCALRLPRGRMDLPVWAMDIDSVGRIYAATPLGIQVFDPTGRLCGIINAPNVDTVDRMCFVEHKLFVWCKKKIYARQLKAGWPY
jgi:sugar lactone lactonase YvrE